MKHLFMLVLLVPSLSFAADYINHQVQLQGLDSSGNSCTITSYTTDYSNGVFALQSGLRKSDGTYINTGSAQIMNNELPLTAMISEGNVCGSLGSEMPAKLTVKGNAWILRERKIEFFTNWITETTYTFKDAQFSPENLLSIEVREGATKFTGAGACKALDKGEITGVFKCTVK